MTITSGAGYMSSAPRWVAIDIARSAPTPCYTQRDGLGISEASSLDCGLDLDDLAMGLSFDQ
jgi:hypothetical protein